MFLLIIVVSFAASALVRAWMKRTYSKWSQIPNHAGVDGFTTARKILDANGLENVTLEVSEQGTLSDHYVPSKNLIRLSSEINNAPSVASIAVAAHECGHAIQDKVGYGPMKAKAVLMPLAARGNQVGLILAIGSFIFDLPALLDGGLMLMLLGMFMPVLTLPIEFDASKRALDELTELKLVDEEEYEGAKSMLRAAALTYVAGAASSAAIVGLLMFRFFKR